MRFVERLIIFVISVVTSGMALLGQTALFSDNFESYTAGANLAGQGGWTGCGSIPVNTGGVLPTKVVRVDQGSSPGCGVFEGQAFVSHSFAGSIASNTITTLSLDAFAPTGSHNMWVALDNGQFGTSNLEGFEFLTNYNVPGWQFAVLGGSGTVISIPGGIGVAVSFKIVIDEPAQILYVIYNFGSGPQTTAAISLVGSTGMSQVNEVTIAGDYRYGLPQGEIDNISLTQTTADTVGPITSDVTVSPNPVSVNTSSALTATVDDLTTGGSNVASAYYSINGGTPSQMLLTPSTAITVQASANLAPIAQSDVYNICVHGADVPGNTGADACTLLPVYDPTGSFVTGGGQVTSPAGADLLNPSAAGQATFGFVSKYLPGRNTPSGNLEFQFKDGNLNFKSTSMDWLVVTGQPRAKFHGTGTVNGVNVCNFEVDAWAGSFTGNVDAFGLKITSCSNGGDRYILPATTLTKGSIIIHN